MLRHIAFALALSFAVAPASALACGMRMAPEKEKLLAELFEDIDAPVEAKKQKVERKEATATTEPAATEPAATEPAATDAVTDAIIPEAQPAS